MPARIRTPSSQERERALEIPRQILAVGFELFGAPDLHFYQCEPAVQNQQ
jgi:hypothetical protein